MKVYLVSKIYCYSDEVMNKDFEVFTDKDSALKYFEEVKESIIEDLIELEDVEDTDELFNIYEETYNYKSIWGYLSPDCTTEFELEIHDLDLLSWKEN